MEIRLLKPVNTSKESIYVDPKFLYKHMTIFAVLKYIILTAGEFIILFFILKNSL